MTLRQNEIIVVGCGMIGGALALGLAQQGFKIIVIERIVPVAFNALAQPDIRISALSAASVNLLQKLGVWNTILKMRAHPYRRLETWEWKKAHVIFDSRELNLPQLGYIVENNVLQQAIWQTLKTYPNVTLRTPASLKVIRRNKQGYHLTLNDAYELVVELVVGADGTYSQVRQMAHINTYTSQYNQSCMLVTIQCDNNPGDSTWQHFTPNGPHAFLPLFDHWASLVWYDIPERIQQLQKLSMSQLEHEINRHFPARLGKVIPVATSSFPLVSHHALQYVHDGLVLIGDAAHTIHPLAGQGVNLGYRDVSTLLDVINHARTIGEQWASQEVLSRYQYQRMTDNIIMQSIMNLFHSGFSTNLLPLRLLRNISLMLIEHSGILKRQILKYALGL